MKTIEAFIKSHPVLSYFALAFTLSWGAFLTVVGPCGFLGTKEIPEVLEPFLYVAMVVGPSVAGILLTGLVYGREGLRELLSRLLRWRVGARWYAIALLPALYLLVLLFSVLPAFRVLMVWVYDRTESLLVAILMHVSLTASTLIFMPLAIGVAAVTYDLVLAAVLWVVVGVVAVVGGRHLTRQPLRRRMA